MPFLRVVYKLCTYNYCMLSFVYGLIYLFTKYRLRDLEFLNFRSRLLFGDIITVLEY